MILAVTTSSGTWANLIAVGALIFTIVGAVWKAGQWSARVESKLDGHLQTDIDSFEDVGNRLDKVDRRMDRLEQKLDKSNELASLRARRDR